MMRSFFGLLNIDAGFDSTNLLTMRLPVSIDQVPDPEQLNRYLREVCTPWRPCPVCATRHSCAAPMQGRYGMPMQPANKPLVDLANRDGGFYKVVSPSHFPRSASSRSRGGCSPTLTPAIRRLRSS